MMIDFLNKFLSYLMVFFVFAATGGVAITLGITLRKMKNKKGAVSEEAKSAE